LQIRPTGRRGRKPAHVNHPSNDDEFENEEDDGRGRGGGRRGNNNEDEEEDPEVREIVAHEQENENENEEEDLNSDDDIDNNEEPHTEHLVLCQWEKVTRVKNKRKCNMKDGVMLLNGRDYLFHKATGEIEF